MIPPVTGKQLARYLGSNYKNAVRLASIFYVSADAGTTELHDHYRNVARDYREEAGRWRKMIRHWKSGDLATWH